MRWKEPGSKWVGPAAIGLALLILVGALVIPKLVDDFRAVTLDAEIANVGGMQVGDPVLVAGVPRGTVTELVLDGTHVDVAFQLDRKTVAGVDTRATVEILTLLGRRALSIEPSGTGQLQSGDTIPLANTTTAFTIDDIGRSVATTATEVDLGRLRTMVDTLAAAAPQDRELLGGALTGLTDIADTVNRNATDVDRLLASAQQTTSTLVDQSDLLIALVGDANIVAATVADRRDAISSIIDELAALTDVLSRYLADNRETIDSLLPRIRSVSALLESSRDSLTRLVDDFGPTARYLANATGNGKFLDLNSPTGLVPDNWLCLLGLGSGCA
ncbi:MCE-family protein Mce1C [Rhodococcus sp. B7740]|uniref:MCE family protein n=1 Tax=Rhodococcus sp. B7740 TaxID=1564114 RepID=UPI0005D88BCB|nr:MCE family protein [Rhodococcus sp. B7740]AJW40234.1 MCE-family protein Mce1C [Rhodococcus sp. B7740]